VSEDVLTRGLVSKNPNPIDIINESGTYYEKTSVKNFTNAVLGYVTPVSLYKFPILLITILLEKDVTYPFCTSLVEQSWLRCCKNLWQ